MKFLDWFGYYILEESKNTNSNHVLLFFNILITNKLGGFNLCLAFKLTESVSGDYPSCLSIFYSINTNILATLKWLVYKYSILSIDKKYAILSIDRIYSQLSIDIG